MTTKRIAVSAIAAGDVIDNMPSETIHQCNFCVRILPRDELSIVQMSIFNGSQTIPGINFDICDDCKRNVTLAQMIPCIKCWAVGRIHNVH